MQKLISRLRFSLFWNGGVGNLGIGSCGSVVLGGVELGWIRPCFGSSWTGLDTRTFFVIIHYPNPWQSKDALGVVMVSVFLPPSVLFMKQMSRHFGPQSPAVSPIGRFSYSHFLIIRISKTLSGRQPIASATPIF